MGELKELNELEMLIKDLIILIVKEMKQHQGKPAEQIKDILTALVSDKMKQEGVDAITGLQNLPVEFKAGDGAAWAGFAVNLVVGIIEVVSAFTDPVAP